MASNSAWYFCLIPSGPTIRRAGRRPVRNAPFDAHQLWDAAYRSRLAAELPETVGSDDRVDFFDGDSVAVAVDGVFQTVGGRTKFQCGGWASPLSQPKYQSGAERIARSNAIHNGSHFIAARDIAAVTCSQVSTPAVSLCRL